MRQSGRPGAWTRPFGFHRGQTDDHLHIDLGYIVSVPREAPGENGDPDYIRRCCDESLRRLFPSIHSS